MIKEEKNKIRYNIREIKKQFSLSEKKLKSNIIFDKLEKLTEFKEAKVVMAYWSMPDEVFTHDFVLKYHKEKEIILPVVKGDFLELRRFNGLKNLKEGIAFGIKEPVGECFDQLENIDLIITPGVAFDKKNNRLGRGRAYYDKLLKQTKAYKVGVCFNFQIVPVVPADQHDVKMDLILHD